MKTLKEWEETELDMADFLKPFDEIDEDFYWNIACGWVPSQYQFEGLIQGGDAHDKWGNAYTYATVNMIEGKFYYLGILPEFKQ